MFATLDPKLRAIELPSRRKVLLSDTVGFIRNLPHTLVTSFRATLEEVEQAEVLLHVRDASSSYGEEQKAQVEKVLGELEALKKPRIEVLNKVDLLGAHEREGLKARGEVLVSARTGEGMEALLAAMDGALHSDPVIDAELRVPQQEGGVLAAIEAGMVVHRRELRGKSGTAERERSGVAGGAAAGVSDAGSGEAIKAPDSAGHQGRVCGCIAKIEADPSLRLPHELRSRGPKLLRSG